MTSVYKCNGKTIRPGQQFVDADGTTHPGSWYTYSVEQKTALGITEIVQESPPDSRLYHWSQNADGTVSSTAKALDDVPMLDDAGVQVVTKGVKSNLIAEVRTQQGSLLSQTDWALVRKMDTSVSVPINVQTWRNAIRAKATSMEIAIVGAVDTAAVAALFLTWDEDRIKSGILYDWPELVE